MVRQIKKTKARKIEKTKTGKLNFSQEVFSFIMKNKKPILFIISGLLVISSFGGGFWYFRARAENRVSERFYNTLAVYWDKQESPEVEQINYLNLLKSFQSIITDSPKSKYADWSLVYVGNCNLYSKNYAKAIEAYNKYISKEGKENNFFRLHAYEGLGSAYIEEGKFAEAIKVYKDYAKNKKGLLADKFLWDIARWYEKIDDRKNAGEYYKKILDNYPNSSYKNEAENRIKFLDSIS